MGSWATDPVPRSHSAARIGHPGGGRGCGNPLATPRPAANTRPTSSGLTARSSTSRQRPAPRPPISPPHPAPWFRPTATATHRSETPFLRVANTCELRRRFEAAKPPAGGDDQRSDATTRSRQPCNAACCAAGAAARPDRGGHRSPRRPERTGDHEPAAVLRDQHTVGGSTPHLGPRFRPAAAMISGRYGRPAQAAK